MKINIIFYYLLSLTIVNLNCKLLHKKNKHFKRERIDMGMSKLMKYAAKGAVFYAGYQKNKPTITKINNFRKKTQYNVVKSFKKPNDKKQTYKVNEKNFKEIRDHYVEDIREIQQDIETKKADLNETMSRIYILTKSMRKDCTQLIQTIRDYVDTDVDEEQEQKKIELKKKRKIEKYEKEMESLNRQMEQFILNDQSDNKDNLDKLK